MGYFANGTEGVNYEAKWCDRCVHQKPDDGGCMVWMLHLLHSYEDCNNPKSYLHTLIPRSKDGLGNEKCTMFWEGSGDAEKPEYSEAAAQRQAQLLTEAAERARAEGRSWPTPSTGGEKERG